MRLDILIFEIETKTNQIEGKRNKNKYHDSKNCTRNTFCHTSKLFSR